jgi:hypothetical protein
VGRFASADAEYLKLITELDLDEVGNVQASMDSLRIDIAQPPRTLTMTFGETVTLDTAREAVSTMTTCPLV